MSKQTGVILLLIGAAMAGLTAVAHMSCIWLGPQCFEMQMAPPDIVQSARDGTSYATLATLFVSIIFTVWALYGLSAAGKIRRLPLLKIGIYTIAAICILRGLLVVPVNTWFPDTPLGPRDWIAGGLWAFTGLCFLLGYRAVQKNK